MEFANVTVKKPGSQAAAQGKTPPGYREDTPSSQTSLRLTSFLFLTGMNGRYRDEMRWTRTSTSTSGQVLHLLRRCSLLANPQSRLT